MPPSIHLVQNNAFLWKDVAIGGTRLWDTPEFTYDPCIDYRETPEMKKLFHKEQQLDDQKIFARELQRLELSLKALPSGARTRLVMTHYPPIGPKMQPTITSAVLEKYQVQACVFGHVHSVRHGALPLGMLNGVRYIFAAADYLDFCPVKVI
jgi:predicted phosphohydrolase